MNSYKRTLRLNLRILLAECDERQNKQFTNVFGKINDMSISELKHAKRIVYRTIQSNKKIRKDHEPRASAKSPRTRQKDNP